MPYAEGRVFNDADSHVMETPDWMLRYADPGLRDRLAPLDLYTGWIIEQAGEQVLLFSSDYPHIEGGRNPLKRFENAMRSVGESARHRFYTTNFVEMMGSRAM